MIEGQQRSLPDQRDQADSDIRMFFLRSDHAKAQQQKALRYGIFGAFLFRAIATMNTKAPLPRLPDQTPTWDKAAALARDWELLQLADRLEKLASGS